MTAHARTIEQHEPGGAHNYRLECEVCGQRGTVRLSIDPERVAAAPEDDPTTSPEPTEEN